MRNQEVFLPNERVLDVSEGSLGQKRDDCHDAAREGISYKLAVPSQEGEPALIEIGSFCTKPAVSVAKSAYFYWVVALRLGSWVSTSSLSQELPMPRRMLLTLVAGLAVIAVAACADITAPKHEDPPPPCPIGGGPDTCKP